MVKHTKDMKNWVLGKFRASAAEKTEDYFVKRRAYWEKHGYTEDEAVEAAIRDINESGL